MLNVAPTKLKFKAIPKTDSKNKPVFLKFTDNTL